MRHERSQKKLPKFPLFLILLVFVSLLVFFLSPVVFLSVIDNVYMSDPIRPSDIIGTWKSIDGTEEIIFFNDGSVIGNGKRIFPQEENIWNASIGKYALHTNINGNWEIYDSNNYEISISWGSIDKVKKRDVYFFYLPKYPLKAPHVDTLTRFISDEYRVCLYKENSTGNVRGRKDE